MRFIIFFIFLIIFLIPISIISLIIKLDSSGPIIFWSKRVGKNDLLFLMPKFRTMYEDTPQVATHLLTDEENKVTKIGKILRKYSLDEIPQIYSIYKGDMDVIGPRPALFNQDDLIKLRRENKINTFNPGLTGWAQVNGRDSLSIPEKVKLEVYYMNNKGLYMDLKIIFLTIIKIINKRDISH